MAERKKESKRKTVKADPLAALIGDKGDKKNIEPDREAEDKQAKIRLTVHVTAGLVEDLRNAAYWESGPPLRLTLAEMSETAIREYLIRLQKKRNGGKPYPPRDGELRGGRPIK